MIKQSGAQYLTNGWQLIRQKGVRHWVFIPLTINFVLLLAATIWVISQLSAWQATVYEGSGDWLQWTFDYLGWLLWPLLTVLILLALFFSFAVIANWISAPFNGLLSEAVERHLKGAKEPSQANFWQYLRHETPRVIQREWQKLKYWLPRALICLLLFWIPVINIIAPVIWIDFSAWMLAIQYIDYPMDNNKVSFSAMLATLKQRKMLSWGFGGTVLLFTMIPLLNLLIIPVAIAGATSLYVDHFDDDISQ